jgi:signal transduction histidine kinase
LGLSICRELVAQLHGQIALDSEVGAGTSVSIRFPIEVH